jgi:manganese/zinc/iron transport system substrate-binding protein
VLFRKKFFLFATLLLIVCGCSDQQRRDLKWREANGKLKVLTTIAMIDDIVKQVGGDDVDTIALIRGELDPHSYELVKGDDEKFSRAHLIFYNGLGLEHGLSLRQNLVNNPKAVAIAEPLLAEDPDLILMVDGEYDPHIWMDIALWMRTIDPIVKALSEKDQEHAAAFRARGEQLRLKMEEADQKVYATLQAIQAEKRYLVTSHDAFHYFTRHYLAEPGEKNWRQRCKAPEGLAPEAQMSVADVIDVIVHIEAFHIPVLFPESNVSKDALRKIVDATKERGFAIRLCQEELYGDSMGRAGSYLEMITHNVEVLARELSYYPKEVLP